MAKTFFGAVDPVGKTLRVDNNRDFTVIGVVKDPPQNVSLRYDFMMPVQNFMDKNAWLKSWGTYGISTIVELRPDANVANVAAKVPCPFVNVVLLIGKLAPGSLEAR